MQESVRRVYLGLGAISIILGLVFVGIAVYGLSRPGPPAQWVYVRPHQPSPVPAVAGVVQPPAPPLGDRPFRLLIDKLGVDAPVATFGLDDNAVPEVPYEGGVVAWYDFTATPGMGSNAVFAGHLTWYGDAVFKRLGELQPGDRIALRGENGAELAYEVASNDLIDPSDPAVMRVFDATESDTITLITCGGTFYDTDDPIAGGEYDLRQVVRARFLGAVLAEAAEPQPDG